MRRSWILPSLAMLLITIALGIGLTPVQTILTIAGTGNRPSEQAAISCGSPLFKQHRSHSAPLTGLPQEGSGPCNLTRDHRRLPVEILGGLGLALLAATTVTTAIRTRRTHTAAAT